MADTAYPVIKTKELKNSTFRRRIVNFKDLDISDIEFEVIFSGNYSSKIITGEVEKVGNTVLIPLTAIEKQKGIWEIELWMTDNGNRDKAIQWDLEITDKPGQVEEVQPLELTITHNEQVIDVTVSQSIVEMRLAFEDLTPEQKLELKGEKGDNGDASILEFEVDDEMNLIQYSAGNNDLDFGITSEGKLTLTF